MEFPIGYPIALTVHRSLVKFPNAIIGTNLRYTSLRTEDYNCTAWATEIIHDWVQFDNGYDTRISTYISYFEQKNFVRTDNKEVEIGVTKIAIYFEGEEFKHVARQLKNGKWTSKIGDWEDVEHDNIEILFGEFYGTQTIIMQRIDS
jgi:hypothetical protein